MMKGAGTGLEWEWRLRPEVGGDGHKWESSKTISNSSSSRWRECRKELTTGQYEIDHLCFYCCSQSSSSSSLEFTELMIVIKTDSFSSPFPLVFLPSSASSSQQSFFSFKSRFPFWFVASSDGLSAATLSRSSFLSPPSTTTKTTHLLLLAMRCDATLS